MKQNENIPRAVKIGLLGDTHVGKSAICNTFIGIEFYMDMISTIGYEKFDKKVKLKNGEDIKIVFYDTGGAERFRAVAFKTLRNVQGIILVFDLAKRETFAHLYEWLNTIKDELINPFIILFGNKADLNKDEWEVNSEEINQFVTKFRIPYFEVSAKTGKGINEGFSFIANEIYNKLLEEKKHNKDIKEENKKIMIKKDDIIKEKKNNDCVRNKNKK